MSKKGDKNDFLESYRKYNENIEFLHESLKKLVRGRSKNSIGTDEIFDYVKLITENGTPEDVAVNINNIEDSLYISFGGNKLRPFEEFFFERANVIKLLNKLNLREMTGYEVDYFSQMRDIHFFLKLFSHFPYANEYVKDFFDTMLNEIIMGGRSDTNMNIVSEYLTDYYKNIKNIPPDILSLYIQASAQLKLTPASTNFFNPETIYSLIKSDASEKSIYTFSPNPLKEKILGACMQIFRFNMDACSESEKKASVEIIDFLLKINTDNTQGFNPILCTLIDTKNSKSVLSLVDSGKRMKFAKKYFDKIYSFSKAVFSNIYNLQIEEDGLNKEFIKDFASLFDAKIYNSLARTPDSLNVIIFDDKGIKISNAGVKDQSALTTSILENINAIPQSFKNEIILTATSFLKSHNKYLAILDKSDVSEQEKQYDIKRYTFFSDKVNALPAPDNTVTEYTHFEDKENNLYSVSFKTNQLPHKVLEDTRQTGLFGFFKKDIVMPGENKINKYFNMIDSTFAEKVINFPTNGSKDLANDIKETYSIIEKYKKDLEDINNLLRQDDNTKNDIFLENLDKLNENINQVTIFYKNYIDKGTDIERKLEHVFNDFIPVLEESIKKFNIYSSSNISGIYKNEMKESIENLSKEINDLIKGLDLEITNIINSENLYDMMHLSAKIKATNAILGNQSIDEVLNENMAVIENENVRITKKGGSYTPQIPYMGKWIDIKEEDLKEIDNDMYNKLKELSTFKEEER